MMTAIKDKSIGSIGANLIAHNGDGGTPIVFL